MRKRQDVIARGHKGYELLWSAWHPDSEHTITYRWRDRCFLNSLR